MIEKKFIDRVPRYPNRVKLSPVAGQADTYDMTRADEPRVEGTPLDKLAFESIIHSRLTGRYYVPTVSRTLNAGQAGLTVSPLPTSGWIFDESTTSRATNGSYVVESSSDQAAYSLADEVFTSGGWQSGSNSSGAWIMVYHPQAIKVRRMRLRVESQYPARLSALVIEGSNNGTTWTELHTATAITEETNVTYTLTSTGDYTYYRLRFEFNNSNRVTVSNWAYALYDIATYNNAFTVAEGLPTEWSDGQRLTIYTTAVNTFAVTNNALNGVPVNTILQPNRYYELIYIASSSLFIAREA